ncbi:MAG: hypothetical protein LBC31_09715 [Treponema sp.]|jgi:hypothetical protein|nr:hypothetical protein [Treponema sp.]
MKPGIFALLCVFTLSACDMVNAPLKDFIADQTGRAAGENWAFVTPFPADTETSSAGWVRFPEPPANGDAVIRVRLDNPQSYDLSITAENSGAGTGTVTARLLSPGEAEVTIADPALGETYRITLVITGGPGGLRDFPPFTLPPFVCNTPLELTAPPTVTGFDVDWTMPAGHPGVGSASVAFQQRGPSPGDSLDITERYGWDGTNLVIAPGQQGLPGGSGKVRFPAAMNTGDHHVKVTVEDDWGFRAALPSEDYFTPLTSAAEMAKIGLDGEYPLDGNYELYADLSLNNWTPAGNLAANVGSYPASVSMSSGSRNFTGIFRGNDRTIVVRSLNDLVITKRGAGIFAGTDGARIENLRVIYACPGTLDLSGLACYFMGGVVGYARNSELVNLRVSGALTVRTRGFFGGIAGYSGNDHTGSGNALIENCVNDAEIRLISTGLLYAGGITGMNDSGTGSAVIQNSHTFGNLEASGSSTTYLGGIAADNGRFDTANSGIRRIVNCSSSGAISLHNSSGEAIAGGITANSRRNTAGVCSIENCYSTGPVNASTGGSSNAFAGGITGYSQGTLFTNCYATGNVSITGNGDVQCGGIAGVLLSGSITNCYAAGSVVAVSSSGSYEARAGGITGHVYSGTVKASAAVNPSLSAAAPGSITVHRVVGTNSGGTLTNNIAWDGMALTGGSVTEATAAGRDGAGKTKAELSLNHSTWETLFTGIGFSTNWKWLPGYPYPALQWQTAVPAYTPLP